MPAPHSSTQAPKARLRRPSSNPSISDLRRKQHVLYLILSQILSYRTNFNFRALGFPRLTIYRPGLLNLAQFKSSSFYYASSSTFHPHESVGDMEFQTMACELFLCDQQTSFVQICTTLVFRVILEARAE